MQLAFLDQHITESEAAIRADNDATEAAIRADNQATKAHVDSSLEQTTANLTQRVNGAQAAMTGQKAEFDQTAQQLNTRMDEVLAAGTGDGATEIADARVDVVEGIGPDAVLKSVFPVVRAGRDDLVVFVEEDALDAGGAELDPEGCFLEFHGDSFRFLSETNVFFD